MTRDAHPADPTAVTMLGSQGLAAIFEPRSVAVVGASRNPDSIGFALLHNLLINEFSGAVFPVNPNAQVIHSLKCYPSVAAIPDPVDLAILVVPRRWVLEALEDCLAAGVRGLVVITAGFSETGAEGAELERQLQQRVRAAGVRMVGPNCMGVINTDPSMSLNATFAPPPARAGSIGFVSQSGALGVAILNVAADLGIGLTQFVSVGNKADVSGNDLLEYWEEDEATRVIAMYLESFGNPRRFTEIAKRVSRRKPILIVKSGRTAEGARAASSHTGALAGTDLTVSTFLEHCGVQRVSSIAELFHVARAFDCCPLPRGRRLAIVTNAGGPGIMATDAAVNLGLEIATLTPASRQKLASFLPPEASTANPVDMIASAGAEAYGRSVEVVLEDDEVDLVMVINVTPLATNPKDVIEAVAAACARYHDASGKPVVGKPVVGKPVLAVVMATEEFYEEIEGRHDLPPIYHFPEDAAGALAHLARYAAWRQRPQAAPAPFDVDDAAVAALLAGTSDGYLPAADAFRVLELYGIPVAPWRIVDTADAVVAAARDVGFPLVLKAEVPGLVHKSDAGAVAVDLADEAAVEQALATMTQQLAAAGLQAEGYLLQRMVHGGREVIFGISTDPRFGPLLMFGLGGRYVEVFHDVRFGVTPLAPPEAGEMIRGIRGFPLLEGVRGDAPVDLSRLEDTLLRLAQLAERHPAVRELDINPFLASEDPQACLAVDVRLRVG